MEAFRKKRKYANTASRMSSSSKKAPPSDTPTAMPVTSVGSTR
jgi:hypothetical protein